MKGESAKNERRRVFVPSRGVVSRKMDRRNSGEIGKE